MKPILRHVNHVCVMCYQYPPHFIYRYLHVNYMVERDEQNIQLQMQGT